MEGTEKIMKKFSCTQCSYLYRPAFGEEEAGIPPGTPFENVAQTFRCPSCGASEEFFHAAREQINDPLDPKDLSEEELSHFPRYRETEDGILVLIGSEDSAHPDDDEHFLEWVSLVDDDGEDLEAKIRPV
jgi:rubredoxin